jgi:hypothetical protein
VVPELSTLLDGVSIVKKLILLVNQSSKNIDFKDAFMREDEPIARRSCSFLLASSANFYSGSVVALRCSSSCQQKPFQFFIHFSQFCLLQKFIRKGFQFLNGI